MNNNSFDSVTRPLCLVESHTLDAAARQERSPFISHTFCPNNSSCILRLNDNIHLYPFCCVSLLRVICYDQLALTVLVLGAERIDYNREFNSTAIEL